MVLSNDDIIFDSDPRLRQRSATVSLPLSDEDREFLLALHSYVKRSQDDELCETDNLSPAVGLAAIQVGVAKKMIAVVVDERDEDGQGECIEYALANPRIVNKSQTRATLSTGEGCLSVPDTHPGHVSRSNRIKVKAYDALTDQDVTIEAEGYLAIVLQHEIDHLSGVLYYDRIDESIMKLKDTVVL